MRSLLTVGVLEIALLFASNLFAKRMRRLARYVILAAALTLLAACSDRVANADKL